MIGIRASILVAAACLLAGCESEKQKKNPQETNIAPTATTAKAPEKKTNADWINEVIALCLAGREPEAMALLLDETPPKSDISIPRYLSLSEKELQNLPSSVSSELMKILPKASDKMLSFSRKARAAVKRTAETDKKKARALRLRRLGEELSRQDRLAVFQMIGQYIGKWEEIKELAK